MLRMMIAASAVLLPTASYASASITVSDDGRTARVGYDDLNLGSPSDRSRLTTRIHRAANMLCFEANNAEPLTAAPERVDCYRIAVANGVAQMNVLAGH